MLTPQFLFHRGVSVLASIVCLICLGALTACEFPTPLTANAGLAAAIEFKTPTVCSAVPGNTPGPTLADRIVDLDPSIPQDGKAGYVILMQDGEMVNIFYTAQGQLDAFLNEFSEPFCALASYPPTCLVGGYPGEPPDLPTCSAPTETGVVVSLGAPPSATPSVTPMPASPTVTRLTPSRTITKTLTRPPTQTRTSSPSATATLSPTSAQWLVYPPPDGSPTAYPPP